MVAAVLLAVVAIMQATATIAVVPPMDWTYTAPFLQWGAVDIRNSFVWAATDDAVLALDPTSGKLSRRYGPYPGLAAQPSFIADTATASPPTLAAEATSMLLPTGNGTTLTLVDLTTGRTRWVASFTAFAKQDPVVGGVSCAQRFFALVPSGAKGSAALIGRCGMADKSSNDVVVVAVSAVDGSLLWASSIGGAQTPNFAPPVVSTERVSYFLNSVLHTRTVTARMANSTALWAFTAKEFLDGVVPVAVCGDVTVVMTAHTKKGSVFSARGGATAIDAKGKALWTNDNLPYALWGPPVCVRTASPGPGKPSLAMVALMNNSVVKLSLADGSVLFSAPIPTGQVQDDFDDNFVAVDEENSRIVAAFGTPRDGGNWIAMTLNVFDLATGALQNTAMTNLSSSDFGKSIAVLPSATKTAVFMASTNRAFRLTL